MITADGGDVKEAITLKGGAGSAAPRIAVHAASFDEALELLQGDAKLASLPDQVQSAVKHFNAERDS